jgi:hypothetical protein
MEFNIDAPVSWLFWDATHRKNLPIPMTREKIEPGTKADPMLSLILSHCCSNPSNGDDYEGTNATIFQYDIEAHCNNFSIFATPPDVYGEPYTIHSIWRIDT